MRTITAEYFDTLEGRKYYRDSYGNVYTLVDNIPTFCSNVKRGRLTPEKAEPDYPVYDTVLLD